MTESRFYETKVARYLSRNNPDYSIKYNHRVIGRISGISRQIDVWMEGRDKSVAVECKFQSRKIDIKTVEGFISFLEDVGAEEGILVSNIGATKSCAQRIASASIRIRILGEEELEKFSFGGVICWQSEGGAVFEIPYGWNSWGQVDELQSCCVLVPVGRKLANIMVDGNFIYTRFSSGSVSITEHVEYQIDLLKTNYPNQQPKTTIHERNGVTIRKSFLPDKNRYDIALHKSLGDFTLIFYGILEADNVGWVITALEKSLETAEPMQLMSMPDEIIEEREITLEEFPPIMRLLMDPTGFIGGLVTEEAAELKMALHEAFSRMSPEVMQKLQSRDYLNELAPHIINCNLGRPAGEIIAWIVIFYEISIHLGDDPEEMTDAELLEMAPIMLDECHMESAFESMRLIREATRPHFR